MGGLSGGCPAGGPKALCAGRGGRPGRLDRPAGDSDVTLDRRALAGGSRRQNSELYHFQLSPVGAAKRRGPLESRGKGGEGQEE